MGDNAEESLPTFPVLDTAMLLGRLQLEKGLRSGVVRLIGFLAMFLTILNAYTMARPNADLFSVQSFFENTLDLPQLSNAADLQEVRQQLVRISRAAKPLMLLSSSSLVDTTAGDLELVSDARNFPNEQALDAGPETRILVDGPQWTLSAWVKGRGNLFKRVIAAGAITCWAWEVDDVVRLRFGGHDSERESTLEGGTVGTELQHLAIVVLQQRSVKFFRNGNLEKSVEMLRDVTDCDGQLVVADKAVTIAALKFHARALKDREVQDMFLVGRPLVEMATGKSPVVVQSILSTIETATSQDPELDLVLQQNALQLDAFKTSDNPAFWAGQQAPVLQGTVQVQEKVDLMFNLNYFSLIDEPVRVESSVPVNQATLPELPAAESFTYVFWSRMSGDGAPFGWFRKSFAHRGSAVIANSVEFKRPYMGTSYNPDGDAPVAFTGILPTVGGVSLGGSKWRLFVFVYDVTTQSMRGYLDGNLIQDTRGKPGVDLPQAAVVNTYPNPLPREDGVFPRDPKETAEIGLFYRGVLAHMRIYKGAVWTKAMIQRYHLEAETLGVRLRECKGPDGLSDDASWTDSFGHNCGWFAAARRDRPQTRPCEQVTASQACPVACGSVPTCWQGWDKYTGKLKTASYTFESRERTQHLQPANRTTLCAGQSVNRNATLAACRALSPADRNPPRDAASPYHWTLYSPGEGFYEPSKRGPKAKADEELDCPAGRCLQDWPADLVDCDQLDKAWADCSFDDIASANAIDSLAGEEAFFISFWFKNLDNWKALPEIRFFSSIAPLRMDLYIWVGLSPRPYMTMFDVEKKKSYTLAVPPGSYIPGVWNKVMVGWQWDAARNGYRHEFMWNSANIKSDATPIAPAGTKNPLPMFKAFTVDGHTLVSGIKIRSGAWAVADRQDLYYSEKAVFTQDFQGPRQSEQVRAVAEPVMRQQLMPNNKPMLIAPPILVNYQSQHDVCEGLSAYVLERQSQLAETLCRGTYGCLTAGEPLIRPSQLRTCAGDLQTRGPHFGIEPRAFRGDEAYADFLFSLDAAVVVRDGIAVPATDFVDIYTSRVLVLFAFWTPEVSAASLLSIEIDLGGIAPEASWSVNHLVVLDGPALTRVRAAFIGVYVIAGLVALATFFLIHMAFQEKSHLSHRHRLTWPFSFVVCILDLILLITVVAMTAFRQAQIQRSSSAGLSTFGSMSFLKWEDEAIAFDLKLKDFFSAVKDVDRILAQENASELLGLLVLLVMMARLITVTRVHPRVGLIPSSLMYGFDDLIHFVGIFIVLFLMFAVLATWTMGSSREEFVDVPTSCATQFNMMIGGLPDGWSEDVNMLIYVSVNFIVFFFLLLNFLLAIIVEAYMKTRSHIEDIQYERNFFTDALLCFYHPMLGYFSGWPTGRAIRQKLEEVEADEKKTVFSFDLRPIFPNDRSLDRFISAYNILCSLEDENNGDGLIEVQIQTLHDKMQKMQETQDEMLALLRKNSVQNLHFSLSDWA